MPMPLPKNGETQDEFMNRFMGNPTMVKDYPDEKQRYAVGMQKWRDKQMTKQLNYSWAESDLIDKYIRVNKKEKCAFKDGTIGMIDLNAMEGIWALVGTTVGDENKAVYSYLFDKKTWTEEAACKWVETAELTGEIVSKADNGESLIIKIVDLLNSLMDKVAPQESMAAYAELKELKGVEIFATGKWNGDLYTQDDLKEIVESFPKLKQTLQPYVKLGHNESQPLLAKDGLPAAGWIENVYIQGNKLLADIKDMPSAIYELVKNKAYKRISSEIYWNLKDFAGNVHKRALKAIALLGGDTPAVGSLADVQALYTKRSIGDLEGDLKTAEIRFYTEGDIMDLEQLKAEHAEQIKAKDEEIAGLKKQYEEAVAAKEAVTKELEQRDFSMRKAEAEKKVDELIAAKKLLPAQKEFALEQLLDEKSLKSYSDKKEKWLDDNSFVQFCMAGADVVDTKEHTANVEPKKEDEKAMEVGKKVKEAADYSEARKVYTEGSK